MTPGAYRISSNSAPAGSGGIENVAFQNPNGSIALIASNEGNALAAFNVNWAPNSENFTYILPAGAVGTFTWIPRGGSLPSAPSGLTTSASTSSNQINQPWVSLYSYGGW